MVSFPSWEPESEAWYVYFGGKDTAPRMLCEPPLTLGSGGAMAFGCAQSEPASAAQQLPRSAPGLKGRSRPSTVPAQSKPAPAAYRLLQSAAGLANLAAAAEAGRTPC